MLRLIVYILTPLSRTHRLQRHFYLIRQANSTSRPTPLQSTKQHTTSAVTISKCSTRSDHCTSTDVISSKSYDPADPRQHATRSNTPPDLLPAPSAITSSPSPDLPPQADTPDPFKPYTKAPFYPSASTSLSPSQPVTLTYHLVTPHLALVASLPTPVFEMRRGLVEWNVVWFREGVREIWEVEKERSEGELA